jgi:quinol monooxygenase YgiN
MIISVLQLVFQDGKADDGLAAVHESLKNTRKFDGCIGVEVAQDVTDSHKVTIVERWQSLAHDTAYREWATANGARSGVGPLLAGPPSKAIGEWREDV